MTTASFCHRCGVPLEEDGAHGPTAVDVPRVAPGEQPEASTSPPTAPETPRRRATQRHAGGAAVARPGRVDDEAETNDLTAGCAGPADPHAVAAVTIPPAIFEEAWEPWVGVHPLPEQVSIRGRRWVLVDSLEPADRASSDLHSFEIHGADLVVREEGEGRYPTGVAVYSTGLRQKGGTASFVIRNLEPRAPVVLVRQVLTLGPERTSVRIDGEKVGSIEADDVDRDCVWRNRIFALGSQSVTGGELRVEFTDDGSEPGLTWFSVWCYQSPR